MTRIAFLALLLAALLRPAAAADWQPMTPSEFRAYAEGWTLHFERNGQPYGSETFREGDRTVWRFHNGQCTDGVWEARGAQICFTYPDGDPPICWRFMRDGAEVMARLIKRFDAGPDLEITVARRTRVPLVCGAPAV